MVLLSDMIGTVVSTDAYVEVEQKIGVFQKFLNELPQKALNLGIRVVLALVFFFIGTQVIKLIRMLLKKSLKKANAEQGVMQFLDSLVKVILYVILLFSVATGFGLDATSVVAVLGSTGVAIGLALQGSLSNFAGGVLILMLKPFKVGDYIHEDNNGNEGTVTEIQLFYTKLITFDDRVVVLPNGALANTSLTNYTATPLRRLDMIVSISYKADIAKAKELVGAILEAEQVVLKEKEHIVFVSCLNESGIDLNVRCYVKNEDYWPVQGRILEKIKLTFDANGIEIPYRQMDVHLKNSQEH